MARGLATHAQPMRTLGAKLTHRTAVAVTPAGGQQGKLMNNRTNIQEKEMVPDEVIAELRALVAEAEKIIAQSGSAPSVLSGLRERFERAQHRLGDLTDEARKRVVAGAKATDETIREHPYQSIAVALGAGLLVGVLLGRRSGTR